MLAQNFILREMGFFEFLRSMGFFAPSVQAQNFILRARNSLHFKTNDFIRPMGFFAPSVLSAKNFKTDRIL